ncbi:hypothetical protein KY290_025475 [Solanum tuberosum]|uniref:Uncharacterized protein n=1 Tax=Solanum tuberosum TaxID=4113 RepID=A0ABQ7UTN5_SOLTU|nr:hypothetical protein KY290_025475 [Solanum tuberosum]
MRIRIPLLPPHTDESKKLLAEDIGSDRLYAVDACTVRIMKRQKVLPHHEQLSRMFNTDIEAIKQRTEAFVI